MMSIVEDGGVVVNDVDDVSKIKRSLWICWVVEKEDEITWLL